MYADVELLLMNALAMPRWGHEIQTYPAALIMVIMNLPAILKNLNGELTSKVAQLTSLLRSNNTGRRNGAYRSIRSNKTISQSGEKFH